jgi:hypothetical protein
MRNAFILIIQILHLMARCFIEDNSTRLLTIVIINEICLNDERYIAVLIFVFPLDMSKSLSFETCHIDQGHDHI